MAVILITFEELKETFSCGVKPQLHKKALQKQIKNLKDRLVKSLMFAFQGDITIPSYIPKQSKNILVVSSMHSIKK